MKKLSKFFREHQHKALVCELTFKNRVKDGMSPEEALFSPPKKRGGSRYGEHVVEGITYPDLVSVAKAYGILLGRVCKRYSKGRRGDDLIPLKLRKSYVPEKDVNLKFIVGDRRFKSARSACKELGVKYTTYNKRIQNGWTIAQALELEPRIDGREKKRLGFQRQKLVIPPLLADGVLYQTFSALARAYGMKDYTVRQRIMDYGYTPEEAVKLKGKGKAITVNGIVYPSKSEAARVFGLTESDVQSRLDQGYTPEEAVGLVRKLKSSSFTYKDKIYNSWKELGEEYQILGTTLRDRVMKGMSIDEAIAVGERIPGVGRYCEKILERNPEKANGPGELYFVRIQLNNKFYHKVGITSFDVYERMKPMNVEYEVIKQVNGTLIDVFRLEQLVLERFAHKKTKEIGPGMLDGHTEILLLDDNDIEVVLQYLREFEEAACSQM